MKLSPDFVARRVVDSAVLVPFGTAQVNFNGLLTLNKTGAFLAEKLKEETTVDDLVAALLEKFEIDEETARRDLDVFLDQLRANGALVE